MTFQKCHKVLRALARHRGTLALQRESLEWELSLKFVNTTRQGAVSKVCGEEDSKKQHNTESEKGHGSECSDFMRMETVLQKVLGTKMQLKSKVAARAFRVMLWRSDGSLWAEGRH